MAETKEVTWRCVCLAALPRWATPTVDGYLRCQNCKRVWTQEGYLVDGSLSQVLRDRADLRIRLARYANPWTVQIQTSSGQWREFCYDAPLTLQDAPLTLQEAEQREADYRSDNPEARFRIRPWLNNSQRQYFRAEDEERPNNTAPVATSSEPPAKPHFIIRKSRTTPGNWVLCQWRPVKDTYWRQPPFPPVVNWIPQWDGLYASSNLGEVILFAYLSGIAPVAVDTEIDAHTPPSALKR